MAADASTLLSDLSSLKAEMELVKSWSEEDGAHYGKMCGQAVRDAFESISVLVDSVKKADTKIVDWYHRSSGMRSTLSLVGAESKVHQIIDTKTEELKIQAQLVETGFEKAIKLFQQGIDDFEATRALLMNFSNACVGELSNAASNRRYAMNALADMKIKAASKKAKEAEEAKEAENRGTERHRSFHRYRADAQQRSTDLLATSRVSYAAAVAAMCGAASWSYPPLVVAVPFLWWAGTMTSEKSKEWEAETQARMPAEQVAQVELENLQRNTTQLRRDLQMLDDEKARYSKEAEFALSIRDQAMTLRAEANTILSDLRAAMMMLNSTQTTLKKITQQVSGCGFAETRREIAGRLKEALRNVQSLQDGKKKQRINSQSIDTLMKELMTIEGSTPRILSLIGASTLS